MTLISSARNSNILAATDVTERVRNRPTPERKETDFAGVAESFDAAFEYGLFKS